MTRETNGTNFPTPISRDTNFPRETWVAPSVHDQKGFRPYCGCVGKRGVGHLMDKILPCRRGTAGTIDAVRSGGRESPLEASESRLRAR